MDGNLFAPPQEPTVLRLPPQPPSLASRIGFFLSLPFPVVLAATICADTLHKHLEPHGIAGLAMEMLGRVLGVLYIVLLILVPLNGLLTIIGVGQSPRSRFSWIALVVAAIPFVFYSLIGLVGPIKL